MIEKQWKTKAGYSARVESMPMGHLCGYVAILTGHPLYGVAYAEESDALKSMAGSLEQAESIGKRGILPVVLSAMEGKISPRPEVVFNVHGSVTYSDPGDDGWEGKWVFGFDCAHAGDTREVCNVEYVANECESLAWQLSLLDLSPQETAGAS
jgi:hypothetical protein